MFFCLVTSNSYLELFPGHRTIVEMINQSQGSRCFQRAFDQVGQACASLSQEVQIQVALDLTNCVLESTGKSKYLCELNNLKICFQDSAPEAFTLFSSYLIEIEKMCFFYKSLLVTQDLHLYLEKIGDLTKTAELNIAQEQKLWDRNSEISSTLEGQVHDNGQILDQLKGMIDQMESLQRQFRSSSQDFKHPSSLADLLLTYSPELTLLKNILVNILQMFDESSKVFCLSVLIVFRLLIMLSGVEYSHIALVLKLLFQVTIESVMIKLNLIDPSIESDSQAMRIVERLLFLCYLSYTVWFRFKEFKKVRRQLLLRLEEGDDDKDDA